jgi:ubiquinone/menaquinone biosynthesis C-methylase UbiE
MPSQQRASQISRFYRRIGESGWRRSDYFTHSVRSPAFRHWIASQLPTKKTKILSVGCGTGELESHLSEAPHHVVGLDVSQQMLARARNAGLKLLVQADSHFLPFDVDSFDIVMFIECIGYLHMLTAFKEAWRILRKQGRLVIVTCSGSVKVHALYSNFHLDEIAPPLATAGFTIWKHKFLKARRASIVEVPSADASTLLFVSSTKHG